MASFARKEEGEEGGGKDSEEDAQTEGTMHHQGYAAEQISFTGVVVALVMVESEKVKEGD